MKALSIKPPWAYFIIYGIPFAVAVKNADGMTHLENSGKVILKNIENRDWPLPESFVLPQRVMVHVSKRDDDMESVLDFTVGKLGLPAMPIIMSYSRLLPRGAIIGEVDIVDCVTESNNGWFVGKYGFVLANPEAYAKPIPCKGKLRLFEFDKVER